MHNPKSISQSIPILSSIDIAIRPMIFTISMFQIIFPCSYIFLSILTLHSTLTIKFIIQECTFEDATFLHEDTFTMSTVI